MTELKSTLKGSILNPIESYVIIVTSYETCIDLLGAYTSLARNSPIARIFKREFCTHARLTIQCCYEDR